LLLANCSGDGRLLADARDDRLLASGDGRLLAGAADDRNGRFLDDNCLATRPCYERSLGRKNAARSILPGGGNSEKYTVTNRQYDDGDDIGHCRLQSRDDEPHLLGVGPHSRRYGGVDTLRRGRDKDTYGGSLCVANRQIESQLGARSIAHYPSIQVNPNFV
jgi:hypothetical protein